MHCRHRLAIATVFIGLGLGSGVGLTAAAGAAPISAPPTTPSLTMPAQASSTPTAPTTGPSSAVPTPEPTATGPDPIQVPAGSAGPSDSGDTTRDLLGVLAIGCVAAGGGIVLVTRRRS